MHEMFRFRSFIYTLIKAELHRMFTIKREMNTLFAPKAIHYLAMLMTMSATRSLLRLNNDFASPHM